MNTSHKLKLSLIVAALLSLSVAQAATLTKEQYTADKTRIIAEHKVAIKACGALRAIDKDICVEETKVKESIALAELEYSYTGKAADQTKVLEAKAKLADMTAKETCYEKTGLAREACFKAVEEHRGH